MIPRRSWLSWQASCNVRKEEVCPTGAVSAGPHDDFVERKEGGMKGDFRPPSLTVFHTILYFMSSSYSSEIIVIVDAVNRMASSHACQTCGATEKAFTCVQCNDMLFCDACWGKWVLHLPGSTGW